MDKNFSLNPPPTDFNLPLLHKLFEFYKLVYGYLQLFPNKDKHTLGKKIDNLILEIIELVFFAANAPKENKLNVLEKANIKINLVKILIRLAMEVKALDNKKYIRLQKELQEIGRMVGGWLRSIKSY